jgi:hypothetical protein
VTDTQVQKEYKHLLSHFAKRFKLEGFARKGNYFFYVEGNNIAWFWFQKSRSSSASEILFTVNGSVFYGDIGGPAFNDPRIALGRNGHVAFRLGFFLSDHPDMWWAVRPGTDLKEVEEQIWDLMGKHAVPYMKEFIKVENVLEFWENERANGRLSDWQKTLLRFLRVKHPE